MIRALWPGLALTLILNGCVSFRAVPIPEGLTEQPPAGWSDRVQQLASFDHWELIGKLAVKQPSDSGSAIVNNWTQQGPRYDIALSSTFLGLGTTAIQGLPGFVELTLPNGDQYQSTDPEALIEAATGWQLPVSSLTWWIKGLPDPSGDYRLLFDESSLAVIRQFGWEIHIDRWDRFMEGRPDLPARITATREDKRVRVVVSQWREL